MIISKTPFRVSFFGGGTDYPTWYENSSGAVLSTTIDKYCYISLRYLPPFFNHKHRIVYSKIENVMNANEIIHPVVRTLLKMFKIKKGIEIHHDGDLPAHSGIGSSSAFTVGMLNSLWALEGKMVSKSYLAKQAIFVERSLLKENVGSQDQIAVTYGGLNKIVFQKGHNFQIEPITIHKERVDELENHLMLYFTGLSRCSSVIAAEQVKNAKNNKKELMVIRQMVDYAIEILNGKNDILRFGKLLHESWELKKRLSNSISNKTIDSFYQTAVNNGAIGGKILGAGGGGFMLLFVPPAKQNRIRRALGNFLEVKFGFETEGSKIIYYDAHEA